MQLKKITFFLYTVAINKFGVGPRNNLWPLLFLIHTNDIPNAPNSTPGLFAED